MVFAVPEGTAHIVVAGIDLFKWVGDAEIPDENKEIDKGSGEDKFGLSCFTGPIVDGKVANIGSE